MPLHSFTSAILPTALRWGEYHTKQEEEPNVASQYPDRIRILASRFRDALVACDRTNLGFNLQNFPRGACSTASWLLGTYFEAMGLGTWGLMNGELPRRRNGIICHHDWIERDGIIVDITADQFQGDLEPVIVSRGSPWHRQLKSKYRFSEAHFRVLNKESLPKYERVYAAVLAELEPAFIPGGSPDS